VLILASTTIIGVALIGVSRANALWQILALFGLSVGAGMIVHSYIFAAYFGRAFLGSTRSIVLPVMLISAGIRAHLIGYIHDNTGSYISSWWMILALNPLIALIISSATRPTPVVRTETAAVRPAL